MSTAINHTHFIIVEQWDGRYICVAIYGPNSMTSRLGETLIGYEMDVRSHTKCYEAIADYVCDSGLHYDHDTVIKYKTYGQA